MNYRIQNSNHFRNLFWIGIFIFLIGCSSEKQTDQELTEKIHGVWIQNLISDGSLNFTPKNDSDLFFTNRRQFEIRFSSNETYSTSKSGTKAYSFTIDRGTLRTENLDDTLLNNSFIDFLNYKKLVLNKNNRKFYFEKFVY